MNEKITNYDKDIEKLNNDIKNLKEKENNYNKEKSELNNKIENLNNANK